MIGRPITALTHASALAGAFYPPRRPPRKRLLPVWAQCVCESDFGPSRECGTKKWRGDLIPSDGKALFDFRLWSVAQ